MCSIRSHLKPDINTDRQTDRHNPAPLLDTKKIPGEKCSCECVCVMCGELPTAADTIPLVPTT